jgi:hypothetical protein
MRIWTQIHLFLYDFLGILTEILPQKVAKSWKNELAIIQKHIFLRRIFFRVQKHIFLRHFRVILAKIFPEKRGKARKFWKTQKAIGFEPMVEGPNIFLDLSPW